jgi:DNA adenine methylase
MAENPAFDLEKRAKPILKWAGGKSGPLKQLVKRFPSRFNRYIEPFVGGGAVFFALVDPMEAVLGDSNLELTDLYEIVRDDVDALMAELDQLAAQYSEEFYYELRKNVPDSKLARAARTLFLNKTGFNGLFRLNSKGLFNVPFGKRPVCPALYDKGNMIEVARRLRPVKLLNTDFEAVIAEAGPGDFLYCDPPYEPLSRTSTFTGYTTGGFSQGQQARLEQACQAAAGRGAMVAVSNSTAPFILSLYEGWEVREIQAKRAINSKGAGRGQIAEILAALGYA